MQRVEPGAVQPRWWLFCLMAVCLAASGCKEDWSARLGLRPLWRSYSNPFHAYPLDRLTAELASKPPRFAFVVLGSTDFSSGEPVDGDDPGVYDKIMQVIRSIHPQPGFIFNLGDIAAKPGDLGAWQAFIDGSVPYEIGPHLGPSFDPTHKRCYAVPGDRDVDDRETEREFQKRFYGPSGKLPFSFDWQEFHFIALDSEETDDSWMMKYFGYNRRVNRIAGAQFRWLEDDLGRNEGKKIVVFVHKPLFPPVFSSHDGYCLDQHYSDREKLLGLLKKYSVKAVFMGHEPIFHWARIEKTYHIITGGAGRKPKARRSLGGFHHFLYVTVEQGSGMKVYCVNPELHTVAGRVDVP